MIILLSPSKTLELDSDYPAISPTQPALLTQTKMLGQLMKVKSAKDISALMKVSDKLGELNHQRYQDFSTPFTRANARPSIFTFKGNVYDGLDSTSFTLDQLEKAQKHLRILSGLYGLLRPFDLMQPYRLEMGTKLENSRGKNLYEFWGDSITERLNEELEKSGTDTIINLASNEYFKAVNTKKLNGQLVTPIFKERKGNQLKVVGIHAKKARGMMTRHLLTSDQPLNSFVEANYRLDNELSDSAQRIFTRGT